MYIHASTVWICWRLQLCVVTGQFLLLACFIVIPNTRSLGNTHGLGMDG